MQEMTEINLKFLSVLLMDNAIDQLDICTYSDQSCAVAQLCAVACNCLCAAHDAHFAAASVGVNSTVSCV